MPPAEARCLDCGADASGRFCPACGQSTHVGVPTVAELVREGLGAVFSYDAKVWRTAGRLARHPGALTVDYLAGRRARYLSPFQVFFWLQTVAFLADGAIFRDTPEVVAAKTRALALMGVVIAAALALLYARRRLRFVHHLVAATHLWAFLMLLLLMEYAFIPPVVNGLIALGLLHGMVPEGAFVTLSAEAIMAVYAAAALRRVYAVSWPIAVLQTLAILLVYTAVARLLPGAAGIA